MTPSGIAEAASAAVAVAASALALALLVADSVRTRGARLLAVTATGLLLTSTLLQGVAVLPGVDRDFDGQWDAALYTVGLPLAFVSYPDGRVVPRWLIAPAIGYLGLGIADLLTNGATMDQPWWTAAVVASLLLVAAVVHRYRRRLDTSERERTRWAILGALITCTTMLALIVIAAIAERGTIYSLGPPAVVLANLAVPVFPICLAVGLLRPRALSVDGALRVILLLAISGLVLAVAFWLAITIAGRLGADPLGAGWAGAAAVGALSVPVLRLAARLSDLFVYRGRPGPDAAARILASRLDEEGEATDVPLVLARTVTDSLHLQGAEVEGPGLRFASTGTLEPLDGVEVFPLDYRAERLGTMRVAPRAGESGFTRRDLAVIRELGRRAGPALHGARSMTELIAAGTRVILAREEERKRLRRDLHDDLAPTLVGLGLTASGIARLLRDTDADLSSAADSLVQDVQSAIAQTRELAYGLRPPVLDDQGLIAAIRHRTGAGSPNAGLVVEISAPPQRLVLPAAVELAALRIVQEAVTNVRRHAAASRCSVSLIVRDDRLQLRIEDDGHGMAQGATAGIGLTSIRERARELGGRARIARAGAGGVLVDVTLPVAGA